MIYIIGQSEATDGWVQSSRQMGTEALDKRFKIKLQPYKSIKPSYDVHTDPDDLGVVPTLKPQEATNELQTDRRRKSD